MMQGVSEVTTNWGGKRPGAGRKRLPASQRRLRRVFYCTDSEAEWLERLLADRREKRGERPQNERNKNNTLQ